MKRDVSSWDNCKTTAEESPEDESPEDESSEEELLEEIISSLKKWCSIQIENRDEGRKWKEWKEWE